MNEDEEIQVSMLLSSWGLNEEVISVFIGEYCLYFHLPTHSASGREKAFRL